MFDLLYVIVFIIYISIPIYACVLMIRSLIRKVDNMKEQSSVNLRIVGFFYFIMVIFIILLGIHLNGFGVSGGEPLHYYSETNSVIDGYAALSSTHIPSVITLLIVSGIAYWVLNEFLGRLSPIFYVICCSALILNILFAFFYMTHTGFSYFDSSFSIDVAISIFLLQTGYLTLSFLYIAKLKDSLDYFLHIEKEKGSTAYNKSLGYIHRVSLKYLNMPILWSIFLFPVFVVIQLILVLFGQRPDSFIRVFLDTSSFNYSHMQAPQPVSIQGDGHYLCTVSVKGHKKWVKPTRAGVRHGGRIIVNRQLLIANAFENILEEYTPNSHRVIRDLYNKYGYPISKHIHSKWTADLIYLLMKPFEWLFLIVIYSVDHNPENRINVQYSELRK